MRAKTSIKTRAAAGFVMALAVIAGAWGFELIGGLEPCPMCLTQRWPYYIGMPVLAAAFLLSEQNYARYYAWRLLLLAGAVFVAGAGLGGYHAGVEYGLWPGPAACSGGREIAGSTDELLAQLETVQVIRCGEVSWTLFGMSLAGFNTLLSLVIAAICFTGGKSGRIK